MSKTTALIAATAGASFEKAEMPLRKLTKTSVAVDIKFSGICHSDIHQVRDEWSEGIFPMVPGHEIVGVVSEVGSAVTKHKVGDRVGVGVFVDSCGTCDPCKRGMENYCRTGNVQTYNGRHYDGEESYGGYAKQIVADQDFVLKVPENIDFAAAAPLLCAGVTVYSPLKHWKVGPGMKVAIMGLGGLGHMAVKFAVAMGAETFVLGHTAAKAEDAKAMGATDYLITEDVKESHSDFFDIILNTISADLELDAILGMLKVGGTLIYVGISGNNQSFHPFSLITGLKSIAGANTGSISGTQEMLDFCGEHNIVSDIEMVDASDASAIDASYARVVNSDVRYRFVIDASTI